MDINWKAKIIDVNADAAMKREIRAVIKTAWFAVEEDVRLYAAEKIYAALLAHETWQSIEHGSLRGELGLTDTNINLFQEEMQDVVNTSLSVDYLGNTGANDLGGLLISFASLPEKLENTTGADFTSEGGYTIYWLRWLLRYGTQNVVTDYRFTRRQSEYSRTGLGIMIPKEGGYYGIREPYAGVTGSNWVTESAEAARDDVVAEAVRLLRAQL